MAHVQRGRRLPLLVWERIARTFRAATEGLGKHVATLGGERGREHRPGLRHVPLGPRSRSRSPVLRAIGVSSGDAVPSSAERGPEAAGVILVGCLQFY